MKAMTRTYTTLARLADSIASRRGRLIWREVWESATRAAAATAYYERLAR